MNKSLLNTYRQFRQHSPFMLVGHNAECALDAAKTLAEWKELEAEGVVRLLVKPDDSYDWDDEEERERYGEHGAWGVVGEYLPTEDEDWEHGDSCWGFVGYSDLSSPFENCYVIDIMRQTIDAYRAAQFNRIPQL